MAQVERPLSPHLQVYRLPLTAVASITHRATGVGLGFGTLLLTWWLVAAASGPEAYANFQWFAGSIIGILVLFGFTWALCFHLLNGLRHLFWDAGWGFDKHESHKATLAVVGGSVALTVIVWIAAFIF